MKIRVSLGGKVRVSGGGISWSNRGGLRVRLGGGLSAGKSGIRYSTKAGPFRVATGGTGTRAAIVSGAGPIYYGINSSGPFVGMSASTTRKHHHKRRVSQARIQTPRVATWHDTGQQPNISAFKDPNSELARTRAAVAARKTAREVQS